MDFRQSTIPNMEAKHVQMLDGQVLPPLTEKVSRSPISLYSKKRDEYYERLTRENDEFNDAVEKVCATERARFNAEDAEAEAKALKKYKIFKALKTAALASPVILALFAGIGLFSNLYTYDVKSDGLSGLFITLWVFFSLGAIICSSIFVKNLFQKEVYHSRNYISREYEYSKMSIIVASVALAIGIVIAVLSATSVSKQDGFVFVKARELYYLTDYKGSSDTVNLPEHHNGECYIIKAYAFEGRDDIEAINIPDIPLLFDENAFRYCTGMKEASVPCSLISYIPKGNLRKLTITSGTTIPSNAFEGYMSLESVVIGDSVTSIGYKAFYGCTSLRSVTIGDSVTSIDNYAFENCTSLTSITIPDSVTSIGEGAFENCSSLTSVNYLGTIEQWCSLPFINIYSTPLSNGTDLYLNGTPVIDLVIPDTITEIKNYAFCGCTSLTSVIIPDSVTSIDSYAFGSCTSLTSVTIGNGVKTIGSYAFSWCGSLTSVTIPNSVTKIGTCAFNGCASLASVTIPDSVTTIGDYAFENCSSLTSVTIPDSVTSIGYEAFYGCTKLTKAIFEGTDDWYYSKSGGAWSGRDVISETGLANAETAAEYLKSTYCNTYWKRYVFD